MTWKVTKVHRARYRLPLPCLDGRFLDDCGGSVILNLDVLVTTCCRFFFVFLHGSHSYDEEKKNFKKKEEKKKKKKEWTMLISTSSFFVRKILCRWYWAESLNS